MTDFPRIKSRRTIDVSSWMNVIERAVEFTAGGKTELYHAVGQQDYISVLARTPDGKIPIVRQYRPALEQFTWELPAGMVDRGKEPTACARREVAAKAGLPRRHLHTPRGPDPVPARRTPRLPDGRAPAIRSHLREGGGPRATGRLVEGDKNTVTRCLAIAGAHAEKLHDELVAFSPLDPRGPGR